MKLHRYFLVEFKPQIKSVWGHKKVEIEDVTISISGIGETKTNEKPIQSILITATTKLGSLLELDELSRIIIPEKERIKCETHTENIVNLMSILESCSRQILSPAACVALEPENEHEEQFLISSRGILPKGQRTETAANLSIEWTPEIALALSDRYDGVTLLAEALSAGSEGGMYRDFVKYLELAFGLEFYNQKFIKKLSQFLGSSSCGYDRQEIKRWVDLRHPITHGDLKKTSWIALSNDARPIILRMKQACFDVLFNKE